MAITKKGSLSQALNRLVSSNAHHVRAGVLENSKYPDGTSVPSVAFWNEYGTRTAPSRPFFRQTISEKRGEWAKLAGDAIKMGYTVEHMLGLVGAQMQTDIQYSIMSWTSPPNAPYTVAKKGFDSPLRDTMLMHDSIKYEVVDGGL